MLDLETRAEIGRNIEKHGFSITRAIAAHYDPKPGAGDTLERDVCSAYKADAEADGRLVRGTIIPFGILTRDLTTTATSGGELVGTDQLADQFVELFRPVNAVVGMGATVLSNLKGNVAIPKVSAGATGEWIAENGAPSETTHTTASLAMSPKHIAGYTEIGRTLLIQSAPAADRMVANDLRAAISTALDAGAINGSGTNQQPTGILNTSGIGSVGLGTNGAAITWAAVVDVAKECDVDNALVGAAGYLTNAKVMASMRQTPKQSSGVEGQFILGNEDRLLGHPAVSSNNVPSDLTKGSGTDLSALIFGGNWGDLVIGLWGEGLDVLVNPYADSTKGLIRVSVFLDCDVAVKRAPAFAAVQDIVAS